MLSYLSIGAAFALLCLAVGAGFYIGAKHVERMSGLDRNQDRPEWARESADAVNEALGRTTPEPPDESDDTEDDNT